MHKELAEALPGVVFSGEHLHEVTFFRENFAQRWKLPPEAIPHPISAFLFSRLHPSLWLSWTPLFGKKCLELSNLPRFLRKLGRITNCSDLGVEGTEWKPHPTNPLNRPPVARTRLKTRLCIRVET